MEERGVAQIRGSRGLGAYPRAEAAGGTHPGPARSPARRPGARCGRVSIAGVACYRSGGGRTCRYQLRVYRRHKGEAEGCTWTD